MIETAHLKIIPGTGAKTCISEKHCNFKKGSYIPRCTVTTFLSSETLCETLCSFNTNLINARSPLQGLLVLKVNLIRYFFSDTQVQR